MDVLSCPSPRATQVFLGVLIVVSCYACGGSGGGPLRQTSSPDTPVQQTTPLEKKYHFVTETCDTGVKNFTGEDEHQLMIRYCGSLIDEEFNGNCAQSLRLSYFKKDCLDYQAELGISLLPDDGSIQKVPQVKSVLAGKPSLTKVEETLLNFWVERSITETSRLQKILEDMTATVVEEGDQEANDSKIEAFTKSIAQVEVYLEAVLECGIRFSGPLCRDYDNQKRQNAGLMKSNKREVYFYQPRYKGLEEIYTLEFDLNQIDDIIFSEKAHIYLFTSMDDYVPFNLNPAAYTEIATLNLVPLTIERAFELMKKPKNPRQLIHLGAWIGSRKGTSDQVKEWRQQVYDEFKKRETFIEDETEASPLIAYLDTLKKLVSAQNYQGELEYLTQSANKTLAQEAALRLLEINNKRTDLIPLLITSLSNEDSSIVLHAINLTLNSDLTFSVDDRSRLIPLLLNEDETLAFSAFSALKKFGVTPEMLDPLMRILKVSKNPLTLRRAFELLHLLKTDPARQAMLVYIPVFKEVNLRSEMIALLNSKTFMDSDIPFLKEDLKTPYFDLTKMTIKWLLGLRSDASLNALIESAKSDDARLRSLLLETISQNKDLLKEANLSALAGLFTSFYDELHYASVGFIRNILSDNGTMILIDNMSDPFPDVREAIFAFITAIPLKDKYIANLTAQFASAYDPVRRSIPTLIAKIGSKAAIQALILNINNYDEVVRQAIVEQLQKFSLAWENVTPLKDQYIASNYKETKLAIVQLLAKIVDYMAVRALTDFLSDPDPDLRAEIIKQLDKGVIETTHIYYLRTTFLSSKYMDVKIAIIGFLSKMVGYSASSALIEFMNDPDPTIRVRIYAILDVRKLENDWNVIYQLNTAMGNALAEVRIRAANYAATVRNQSNLSNIKNHLLQEQNGANDPDVIAAFKNAINILDPDGNGYI